MTQTDQLRALRRHLGLIVALLVLGGTAGYALAATTGPTYRSSAAVMIVGPPSENAQELGQGAQAAKALAPSVALALTSEAEVSRAITTTAVSGTAHDLGSHVTTSVPLDTSIVEVTVDLPNAAQAAAVTNALAAQVETLLPRVAPAAATKGLTSTVLSTANPAPTPVAPQPRSSVAIGAFTGLALGAVIALFRGPRQNDVRDDPEADETHASGSPN